MSDFPMFSASNMFPGLFPDRAPGQTTPTDNPFHWGLGGAPAKPTTLIDQESGELLIIDADGKVRRTGQFVAPSAGVQQQREMQLRQTPTSSQNFSMSDYGPGMLGIQQEQNAIQITKLAQEADQFAKTDARDNAQLDYLRHKTQLEDEAGKRDDARATRALMEQIQTRMDTNAYNKARVMSEAQSLQAQMDFQASQANAASQERAFQVNQQNKQANLEQRRGVAQDIATFSRNPGDVGANASYLQAGGPSAISKAIATGQDARTNQALVPLDLLLANQNELANGPAQFNPQMVTAPRVPIPTFQPQQAPDLMSTLGPQTQPQAQPGPVGQNPQAISAGLRAGPGGGPISSGGQTFQIGADGTLRVVPAANGFFGVVDQPTLFLAGENKQPETVNISPNSGLSPSSAQQPQINGNQYLSAPSSSFSAGTNNQQVNGNQYLSAPTPPLTAPASDPARDFLNQAYRRALANSPWSRTGTPTPVGVSAPGTSPFLQEMAAALAAIGQGINPGLFLSEAANAAPTGINSAVMRRTR